MNLVELIKSDACVKVEATATDLIQFADYLIARTQEQCSTNNEMSVNDSSLSWVTTEEASKLCKVSKTTLWAWNKSGYLVASKVGRKKLYALSDIKRLLNSNNTRTQNQ